MLILALINAQYLQSVVFTFEKSSNGQNCSSSDSQYPVKNSPQAKFLISPLLKESPHPLTLFEKPWYEGISKESGILKVNTINKIIPDV